MDCRQPFETPVLLIVWRRPETTRQVIEAIRVVRPTRMFVACDGPTRESPGEAARVEATRELVAHEIDWPCVVTHRYSDVHQGCRAGVSAAISWFFSHVEEGIVLEDDVVPHPTFFLYCAELLERYRHDPRIGAISANNFQTQPPRDGASYYFPR